MYTAKQKTWDAVADGGKDVEHGETRPACLGRAEAPGSKLCPVARKIKTIYLLITYVIK
jgi:hypothetical protein